MGEGGLRRVLENTASKHRQLGRSLCIIVILSLHCTGVVLALFQVPAFDRLYLDTLNNICYIYAYILDEVTALNLTFSLLVVVKCE